MHFHIYRNARNLSESAIKASEEASKLMVEAKHAFHANGGPSMQTAHKAMEKIKEATIMARKSIRDAKAAAKLSLENVHDLRSNSTDESVDTLVREDSWIIAAANEFRGFITKLKQIIDETLKAIEGGIDNLLEKVKSSKSG